MVAPFSPGDLVAYPRPWQSERRYKVLRRYEMRHGVICYDVLDEEIGLVFHRIWLRHCVKVGEDASRRLVAS